MASQLSDHFYIIDDGQTVKNGLMTDLENDPELVNRYLGVKIDAVGGAN